MTSILGSVRARSRESWTVVTTRASRSWGSAPRSALVATLIHLLGAPSPAEGQQLGLGAGWRLTTGDFHSARSVTINPGDGTVVADEVGKNDLAVSIVWVTFPGAGNEEGRRPGDCLKCSLGPVASLNVATFDGEDGGSFVESVGGGIGLALALSRGFSVGMTLEASQVRRLRDHVEVGSPYTRSGVVQTSLSPDDDQVFVDDTAFAVSLKFLYLF